MSEELKPCPFCGSTEVYVEEYEHHPGAMRWRVLCAGCMAGIDTGIRQSMGQAVQDWNHRAERTCRDLTPDSDKLTCSECGAESVGQVHQKPFIDVFSYCPNCGARVEEAGE